MRRQLTELAARLHTVVETIAPEAAAPAAAASSSSAKKRHTLFEAAARDMEESPARSLARHEEIELRKETAERRRQIMERRVSRRARALVMLLLSPYVGLFRF